MSEILAAPWSMPLLLIIYLAVGVGLGFCYFHLVRRTADLFVAGGSAGATLMLTAGRLVLLFGVLYVVSRAGAWPLLAVAAGLLLGRRLVVQATARPRT